MTSTQDPHDLAEALFEAVGTLRRRARRITGSPLNQSLTNAQTELVRLVRRNPGITVASAATALGVAPNTVSTLVTRLSEQDLLVRGTDPQDRRVGRLTLTESARQQVELWRDHRATVTSTALGELTAAERDVLAQAIPLIQRVADALAADEPDHEEVR